MKLNTIFLAAMVVLGAGPAVAAGAGFQKLNGHVPAAVSRFQLQPNGGLDDTNRLHLAIGLPLRNREKLEKELREIYNPASTNYHHFLTLRQFTDEFGPTESDYQTAVAFAKSHGLRVTGTYPHRLVLDVEGAVPEIENALNVRLRTYRHPSENRSFYAPDTEPSVDLTAPLAHISGLNNYSMPHPMHHVSLAGQGAPAGTGSGPGGAYAGGDFRKAYMPYTSLTGLGQSVGLVQFDGYNAGDITAYKNQFGLAAIPLVNVPIDSGVTIPGGNNIEVCLDIEMLMSMAPGLSAIYVFEAPNPSPWEDIFGAMVTNTSIAQFSCSWGGGESTPTCENLFMQMAAQGQSFFNASGDSDAFTGSINFPAESANITQVGGTTLTTDTNGAYVSETVWNWDPARSGVGSSGGVSTTVTIPSWQQGISMTLNGGSTAMRNIPDAALTADNVFVDCNNGGSLLVGGTSCAAPLWAGVAALVNQQAAIYGRPQIGFVNPALYQIGTGPHYGMAFHDITNGNNTWAASPTNYYAVPGYDLCTGWGTPAGVGLIDLLVTPDPLVISPYSGFVSTGNIGGPFNVTSQNLTLTNVGGNLLSWSLGVDSTWLDVSTNQGAIAPGASFSLTVSLDATAAGSLPAGTYSETVWITNLMDSVVIPRVFTLNILGAPVIASQPENQYAVQGSNATFAVSATGGTPLSCQWQKNGVSITGATNFNYTASNVQLTDSGSLYTCVVTNVFGSVTSSSGVLTVVFPVALHSFGGPDGGGPSAELLPAADGRLYGTTAYGGAYRAGTVFSMTTNGVMTTLASFNVTNGAYPMAGLTQGSDGNFYGTTSQGGAGNYGTIFQVTSNGLITTLVTFYFTNGANPLGGLLLGGDGNFYGTTSQGGFIGDGTIFRMTTNGTLTTLGAVGFGGQGGGNPQGKMVQAADGCFYGTTLNGEPFGLGSVFKMTPDGTVSTLVVFESVNGGQPYGGLVLGADGCMYGTLSYGGGGVFKVSTNGAVTTLASFNGTNGLTPQAPLYLADDGYFYGTTVAGGSYNAGTLFRMSSNGMLNTLFSFAGNTGTVPFGALAKAADGNFYGATAYGGPGFNGSQTSGDGTIFSMMLGPKTMAPLVTSQPASVIAPAGGLATFSVTAISSEPVSYFWRSNGVSMPGANAPTFSISNVQSGASSSVISCLASNGLGSALSSNAMLSVLPPNSSGPVYSFAGPEGGNPTGALVQDAAGNFYGTTEYGGAFGQGTVFKISSNGLQTSVFSFGGTNGIFPLAGLTWGPDGNLYGTTGGDSVAIWGTVFKITTNGTFYTLAVFNVTNGAIPCSALVLGQDGLLYGTTKRGGSNSGTVFKVSTSGILTSINSFGYYDGAIPLGGLMQGADGGFYGTTQSGGTNYQGTVYRITADGNRTVIYTFNNYDGSGPAGGLVQGADGCLYGTTEKGGANKLGTVFKMTTNGNLVWSFSFSSNNAANPESALLQGADGWFYGSTYFGGAHGYGDLFKISTNGIWTNLIEFNGANGAGCQSALLQGADGNLYGTAAFGGTGFDGQYTNAFTEPEGVQNGTPFIGSGNGAVFRLTVPKYPPVIIGQPLSQNVLAGGAVSFNVTATGSLPLSYCWMRNGGIISGATNATYTNGFVQQSDSGAQFSCVITNNYGAVTSSVALLTVVAQTAPSTLYSFSGGDGSVPAASLVLGADGYLYGTAQYGGLNSGGTVFRISFNGSLSTLVLFNMTNGLNPMAGLIQGSDGNFYGTTFAGGDFGWGTVFRMTPGGDLTNLVSFNNSNGGNPLGPLLQWPDGSFYGTTVNGGSYGFGTVFNITTNGQLNPLLSFSSSTGKYPSGTLLNGHDGWLYGTTGGGGDSSGDGTVYKITTNGYLYTIISFNNGNGSYPNGGLACGSDGNFYGTCYNGGPNSAGTVYTLSTNGSLYYFFATFYSANGAHPNGPLVHDVFGNFYGTAKAGGAYGYGAVFKLTPGGALSSMFSFAGTNGCTPQAGLVLGADGNLYGTTAYGGNGFNGSAYSGNGTIFCVPLPQVAPPGITGIAPLSDGTIQLTLTGTPGDAFRMLGSTNLRDWHTVASFTDFPGTVQFTDPAATNSAMGFYRMVRP
jgi:uncharacterized repeat protein (TIGR03803 family)